MQTVRGAQSVTLTCLIPKSVTHWSALLSCGRRGNERAGRLKVMSTGDVQASVDRLKGELRHIRYPADLDSSGAKQGSPAALLPIVNYVLLKFSRHVAHQLASAGYELQGKSDARFIEAAFKIFRDKFGLRPVLTTAQFLEQGFAERKLGLISDVIAYCKSFHNAAVRRARLAAASVPSKSGSAVVTKSGVSQASKASKKSKSKSAVGKPVPKVQRHSAEVTDVVNETAVRASHAQLATATDLHTLAQHLSHVVNPWNLQPDAADPLAASSNAIPAAFRQQQERPQQMPANANAAAALSFNQHPIQQPMQANVMQQERRHPVSGVESAAASGWAQGCAEGTAAIAKQPQRHHQHPLSGLDATAAAGRQHQPGPAHQHASSSTGMLPSQQFWHQAAAINAISQSLSHNADVIDAARPTASWFTNPAYTSGPSPMPSPDKQPRSHPPPLPHPSQPATAQYQAASTQSCASTYRPSVPPSRPGTAQATGPMPGHRHSRQYAASQPFAAPQQHAAVQQHPNAHAWVLPITQQEAGEDQQAALPAFRDNHSFPNLPPRFAPHSQAPSVTEASSQPQQQNHFPQEHHADPLAQQRTDHEHSSIPQQQQSSGQHAVSHALLHQQCQQQPMQHHQQRHAQQQQVQQHQQQQPHERSHSDQDHGDVMDLVQQLQQRLVTAEQEAAVAKAEADDRVETMEARVTLLEGRLKFVEGELAGMRQQVSQHGGLAAVPAGAVQESRRQTAALATCLSPSPKRKHQVVAVSQTLPSQTYKHEPEQWQEECSSPTKSTAKTPAGKTGRIGTATHELSVMALQSPLQQACTPGSPASSLHSYTSTKDLIQSIQNRYLEAQSFLKSYKM